MLIDWFTVGAQVLNFLILVWLMKRFLYRPILDAIAAREKRIADELANANKLKADAQKERDDYKHKSDELDQQRGQLLSKAAQDAQAERERLLEDARKAALALAAKRQEALKNEEQQFQESLSRRTRKEVFAISRKTLTDLAAVSLEAQICAVFIRRLRGMEGQTQEDFKKALQAGPKDALVRSAFDLPENDRSTIQTALNETFLLDIPLRFETAPDLISGIELSTHEQKVTWNIADYLTQMEKGVSELLKEKTQGPLQTAPAEKVKPS